MYVRFNTFKKMRSIVLFCWISLFLNLTTIILLHRFSVDFYVAEMFDSGVIKHFCIFDSDFSSV